MTSITFSRGVRLAAITAVAAALAAGTAVAPAYAQPRPDAHHPDARRGPPPRADYHDWHHRDWGGPPVVYGAPAYGYAPPPVVYGGPSVGINLPGVSIGID
jgi:hypothetical protein